MSSDFATPAFHAGRQWSNVHKTVSRKTEPKVLCTAKILVEYKGDLYTFSNMKERMEGNTRTFIRIITVFKDNVRGEQ